MKKCQFQFSFIYQSVFFPNFKPQACSLRFLDLMGQIESSFVDNFDIDVVRHESLTLNYIAHSILIGKIKKIVVVTGAGTSVSAGIPDFRSETGVFSNVQKYNLEEPEDIFSFAHFKKKPEDFMDFIKVFDLPFLPSLERLSKKCGSNNHTLLH